MTEYVTIAHNGDTSLQHYHTEDCAGLNNAKNTEEIPKDRAKTIGLNLCPHCKGVEQPDSHDTRYINALRAAGGD